MKVLLPLLARLVLGATFIVLGFNKVAQPSDFLKAVRAYDVVATDPPLLLNSIAALLPWMEIAWGILLVLGIALRGTALTLLVVLLAFTSAIVARAIDVAAQQAMPFCAVKFDCGCGTGVEFVCTKTLENVGLIACALVVLISSRPRLALRPALFAARPAPAG